MSLDGYSSLDLVSQYLDPFFMLSKECVDVFEAYFKGFGLSFIIKKYDDKRLVDLVKTYTYAYKQVTCAFCCCEVVWI